MKKDHHAEFILDCSITMAWCFEDEMTDYSESILDYLDHSLAIVPFLWPIEVANVLVLAERKKRISSAHSREFRKALDRLPIKIEISSSKNYLENLFNLAKESNLTAYDGAYLDLALEYKLPIATLDKDLRKAAVSHGIELLSPKTSNFNITA